MLRAEVVIMNAEKRQQSMRFLSVLISILLSIVVSKLLIGWSFLGGPFDLVWGALYGTLLFFPICWAVNPALGYFFKKPSIAARRETTTLSR